jgi:RHH-type proline utilization regulon transcriptional repressor/proline dehydrogenase/delta 1-pyrroline-5-carboxylate dehydrogenase
VLHVTRWPAGDFSPLIDAIAASGYGLTIGLHTRIERRIAELARRAPAGNIYVNRNMIGAVVGSQPFGGVGLSGTGPKAGGPDYLRRFYRETTLTVNRTSLGGDAGLLALDD